MRKLFLLIGACLSLGITLNAQHKKSPDPVVKTTNADTAQKPAQGGAHRSGADTRPFEELVTPATLTQKGLFTVYRNEDHYLLEIPDTLLGRDILVVSRMAKAAAGENTEETGYAGDEINETVIRFVKGPRTRLFLKTISYRVMSTDTSSNGMYRSVLNSNLQPISAAFDIRTFHKDSTGKVRSSVIDITEYLAGDNDILFFGAAAKRELGLTNIAADRSYIDDVRSFPNNLEIRTVKTYMRTGNGNRAIPAPATYELNSSLVLLPEIPMKPRYFDSRVGYFNTGYTDFDANPQGVKDISMITRWRLEPKEEDIEKYKNGELVEPKNPIIYYIDPSTPKKWVPYLIRGINDWKAAFEQAGFKNAVIGKEAPQDDSTWSIDDARHNVIVYKPSPVANANGPNVHDPRSGEILETHINWYHNVMSLIHNWYMVQTAAVDPLARKMRFDDSLMGQLIRFVSSHEVGHTLGLRHNFGSSSTVPVELLRNKAWVEANGHTPSIMDYARFNYVAQPEDHISEKGLFPRIGDYDKWAIEWGYKWKPEYASAADERAWSDDLIVERLGKNPRLWFGTESDPNDPRCQSEDLGDDAMKAGSYGIKNLQRILAGLPQWTAAPHEGYGDLHMMYGEVISQFKRYMDHVLRNIGGMTTTIKSQEQTGPIYDFTPRARQKEAMAFLQRQLFTTPAWLMNYKIAGVTNTNPGSSILSIQQGALLGLINPMLLNKLSYFEEVKGVAAAYTPVEMMNDLKRGVWAELTTHQAIQMQRRQLQKVYVSILINIVAPKPVPSTAIQMSTNMVIAVSNTDGMSVLKGQAQSLLAEIKAAIPHAPDKTTRLHLADMAGRLSDALGHPSP